MQARIQHISICRPPHSQDAARHFYGALLGLTEIPPPASLRGRDLIWYQLGDTELHLIAEPMVDDPTSRHLCIAVDSEATLGALRQRLDAAGVWVRAATPIPGRPRFFCRDPFGNTVELTTILSNYLDVERPGGGAE